MPARNASARTVTNYPATDQHPPWLPEADKVLLNTISWALVYTHPGHTSSKCIQAGIWSPDPGMRRLLAYGSISVDIYPVSAYTP